MKRPVVALLAGLFAFALVSASAATLGGLTPDGLGANAEVVAACSNAGVDVDFVTTFREPSPADGSSSYYVDAVVLTVDDLGNCAGADVNIALGTVLGGGGLPDGWVPLVGEFGTADAGVVTVTIQTGTDVLAQDVVSIDVLVTGALPA